MRRPHQLVTDLQQRLDELSQRTERGMRRRLEVSQARIDKAAAQLESLSPLGVLGRGYSLTHRASDGALVRSPTAVQTGELIVTRLAAGQIISRVERTDAGLTEQERT